MMYVINNWLVRKIVSAINQLNTLPKDQTRDKAIAKLDEEYAKFAFNKKVTVRMIEDCLSSLQPLMATLAADQSVASKRIYQIVSVTVYCHLGKKN